MLSFENILLVEKFSSLRIFTIYEWFKMHKKLLLYLSYSRRYKSVEKFPSLEKYSLLEKLLSLEKFFDG